MPSGWKDMHQHPLHTPLWRSTSSANSGQVASLSGVTRKPVILRSRTSSVPPEKPPVIGHEGSRQGAVRKSSLVDNVGTVGVLLMRKGQRFLACAWTPLGSQVHGVVLQP